MRNLKEEAESWVPNIRNSELLALLSAADTEKLVTAYLTWWHVYTSHIQSAPSNRSPHGVNESDAKYAGRAADEEVLFLLQN